MGTSIRRTCLRRLSSPRPSAFAPAQWALHPIHWSQKSLLRRFHMTSPLKPPPSSKPIKAITKLVSIGQPRSQVDHQLCQWSEQRIRRSRRRLTMRPARKAAGSELTKAGVAPVTTTFTYMSLNGGDCSQLFKSDAFTTAKTAYKSAEALVIQTEERKRLTAEALTKAQAEAIESATKCYCEAP